MNNTAGKTKRGGTYALTLLYIEQCHYVHKIGIALSSSRNTTLSTVYAFIFFIREDFNFILSTC
ncbi:hypothetical protein GBT28_17440 [Escherichia coli]|nr:hypothetical protein [Escherichia coli]EGO8036739.1 hypothetical protein [Escherichia coli]EGO8885506.1 hypothetical protein [Escherichia coli]EGO9477862.1 hypothetical protein [Escherichia coli]NAQ99726.1 hypothetical protein [Escherichia coli]